MEMGGKRIEGPVPREHGRLVLVLVLGWVEWSAVGRG
jgi:hypothetical protein